MDRVSSIPPPIPQRAQQIGPPPPPPFYQTPYSQPFPYQQPYGSIFNYAQQPSNYQFQTNSSPTFAEYNFLKTAEESSRGAFQSVESVVNAFVSVANMLNSTHSAIFNSFRALVGVIEQMRALKLFLSNSIVSLFRWLRFIWRSLLALLRLRPRNYANSEAVWTNIAMGGGNGSPPSNFNSATFLFWVIAVAGPFLVYKCISQMALNVARSNEWSKGVGEHYTAQALYDFNAADRSELSFLAFDMLRIAPKSRQPNVKDWLLASNFDGSTIGLVPINYVKLLGKNGGGLNIAES